MELEIMIIIRMVVEIKMEIEIMMKIGGEIDKDGD